MTQTTIEPTEVEAMIDTGFDGSLILPESLIERLGQPVATSTWRMGDGSFVRTRSYAIRVEIAGFEPAHDVVAEVLGREVLIGRKLTDRFRLILDHGREVVVEA